MILCLLLVTVDLFLQYSYPEDVVVNVSASKAIADAATFMAGYFSKRTVNLVWSPTENFISR